MVKVAMITPWKVRCGIFTYTENLSRALAEKDVDVYITRLIRFGQKTTMTMDVLLSKIPVDKVDLIHVQHEYGLYQNQEKYFYPVLKSLGKPIITTMHAVGNWDTDLIIGRASDKLIVHNEYCAKRLSQPSVIIRHGAKPQQLIPKDKARESIGIPANAKVVGYVGFITNYKGLEDMIEAMSKVPNVYLLIGGGYHTAQDTAYMGYLKELAKQKVPNRVHWTGFVSDEDLSRMYSAMDLVVYPSKFATESGALIMALSHGKAVIARDLPPFQEKEGTLMTFKNVDDLAEKIKKMFKDDNLRKQYEQSAIEYTQATSWANIAELHKSLYEYIVHEHYASKEKGEAK